jgi:multidrug efflux pump subunit AcrA (membrane-fusion protein)
MVVEVLKNKGELVGPSEPLFRVVDDTRLRVTGRVNLADYWRVKVGQRVRVWPELDGEDLAVERECFEGRVVFLDRRIDPTTRTATVITEVANRGGMLASGLEARMEILPENPAPAAEPEKDPTAARPAPKPNQKAPRASPLSPANAVTTGALPRQARRDP